MLALKIIDSEVKDFMNKLLRESVFDVFEVRGVEIMGFTKFEISGILDAAARDDVSAPARNYCTWQELRPYVLHIIKGGKKPKSIKIIFSPSLQETLAVHANASALFLNLTYDGDGLLLTTASAQKNFSLDKSLDAAWEESVFDFLKVNRISATAI